MGKTVIKILLVGPRINHEKTNLGGATLSFEYLIQHLNAQSNFHLKIIDTQKSNTSLFSFFIVFFEFLKSIKNIQIVYVCLSQNGIRFLAPPLVVASKIFSKKVIIRPFGGSMKEKYQRYNSIGKFIFDRTVLKADIFYLQTKMLVDYFRSKSKNAKQLVTSRPKPIDSNISDKYKKRFVFIGHVKVRKGINEILNAIEHLDDSYQVDIYGPILDNSLIHLHDKINYKGVVSSGEVTNVLTNYDVLLLPTYYEGEGYPGVIVEAYSHGMPVITTNWMSIPEIVNDRLTGFLIEPKSDQALLDAILEVNEENYAALSQNALTFFNDIFEMNKVMNNMTNDIKKLLNE